MHTQPHQRGCHWYTGLSVGPPDMRGRARALNLKRAGVRFPGHLMPEVVATLTAAQSAAEAATAGAAAAAGAAAPAAAAPDALRAAALGAVGLARVEPAPPVDRRALAKMLRCAPQLPAGRDVRTRVRMCRAPQDAGAGARGSAALLTRRTCCATCLPLAPARTTDSARVCLPWRAGRQRRCSTSSSPSPSWRRLGPGRRAGAGQRRAHRTAPRSPARPRG